MSKFSLKDKYDLSRLSATTKMLFGIGILITFIVGSIGKMFIYDHIKRYKLSERPINVLIFIDEVIYHSLITVTTFNLLIVLLANQTPTNFIATHLGIEVNQEVTVINL
jgi:hypothetical protein